MHEAADPAGRQTGLMPQAKRRYRGARVSRPGPQDDACNQSTKTCRAARRPSFIASADSASSKETTAGLTFSSCMCCCPCWPLCCCCLSCRGFIHGPCVGASHQCETNHARCRRFLVTWLLLHDLEQMSQRHQREGTLGGFVFHAGRMLTRGPPHWRRGQIRQVLLCGKFLTKMCWPTQTRAPHALPSCPTRSARHDSQPHLYQLRASFGHRVGHRFHLHFVQDG
jgi:hypothetical protein